MLKGNVGYRIRNAFTLVNATAFFCGAGVAIVGIFAPRVFADVPGEIAMACFWVGITLIVIGLGWAVGRYLKNPIEKKQRVFSIISLLEKMYKRLEILAEREKNKVVEWEELVKVLEKITKFMGIAVPEVSSADEARKAVEDFEKGAASLFPADGKVQETMKRIVRISRLLDKDGFGLKERRKGDRKYCRLLRSVDEYYDENIAFIDEELRSLISMCVNFNECAANFLLYREHLNVVLSTVPNILTPSVEADIEGFEDEIREIGRRIRVKVGEKIKRLLEDNGAKDKVRSAISELESEVSKLGGQSMTMAELFWKTGDHFLEGILPGSVPGNIYEAVEGADKDECIKAWGNLKKRLRLLLLICDAERPHPHKGTGYTVITTTPLGASVLNELDKKWRDSR